MHECGFNTIVSSFNAKLSKFYLGLSFTFDAKTQGLHLYKSLASHHLFCKMSTISFT